MRRATLLHALAWPFRTCLTHWWAAFVPQLLCLTLFFAALTEMWATCRASGWPHQVAVWAIPVAFFGQMGFCAAQFLVGVWVFAKGRVWAGLAIMWGGILFWGASILLIFAVGTIYDVHVTAARAQVERVQ